MKTLKESDQKTAQRKAARERRDKVSRTARQSASLRILARARTFVRDKKIKRLALYLPIGSEVDTSTLLSALHADGIALSLPRTTLNGLDFHRFASGDEIHYGEYREPRPSAQAPRHEPQMIFAPLLAFDKTGGRLGWGGGYYDRALAARRRNAKAPVYVGLGFAAQQVERVPMEAHDQKLDIIITEKALIVTGKAP